MNPERNIPRQKEKKKPRKRFVCRWLVSRLHTFLNNGVVLEKHSARLKPPGAADNRVKLNNIDLVLHRKGVHPGDNSFDHANSSQVRSFNLRHDVTLSLSPFLFLFAGRTFLSFDSQAELISWPLGRK